jgi:hypothetical protein
LGFAVSTNPVLSMPQSEDRRSLPMRLRQFKHALSAKQLAPMLGLTPSYILKRAKTGKILSYRIGGAVRFDPAVTADWLESQAG